MNKETTLGMPFVEILVNNPRHVKEIKTLLEEQNSFSRPIVSENGYKVIKTKLTDGSSLLEQILSRYSVAKRHYELKEITTHDDDPLIKFTKDYLLSHSIPLPLSEELIVHLPLRYTLYSPLVLFNNSAQRSFLHGKWHELFAIISKNGFFESMLQTVFPQFTHIAINKPIIEEDVMRRPFNIHPLYGKLFTGQLTEEVWEKPTQGDFDRTIWCHVIQNGIHQFWSPVFTMFSRGNIKEKKRILDTYPDIESNDVVDLYAGIGYFTLSYLKRGARRVFCFELNPWSIEGLKRGVDKNKFEKKCFVYNESNENCIERLGSFDDLRIRHINLGLLPSSKPGWPLALELITKYNCLEKSTLHIHENVHIKDINSSTFVEDVLRELQNIESQRTYKAVHLEKIKTFAPDVWHVCLDVDVYK